jgi:hypothetical protein
MGGDEGIGREGRELKHIESLRSQLRALEAAVAKETVQQDDRHD